MTETFTSQDLCDTLGISLVPLEELEIMSRYHNNNAIYLYCTLEREIAEKIIQTNQFPSGLCLYETRVLSVEASKNSNILCPETLRIALNQSLNPGEVYYDQLTMPDEIIKKKFKISIKDYKSKSVYTRELITLSNLKQKVIRYTVNDTSKLYINPQYIE